MEVKRYQYKTRMNISVKKMMDLSGKIVIITGGAGLLGIKHAEAVAEFCGIPILLDINDGAIANAVSQLKNQFNRNCTGYNCDITDRDALENCKDKILKDFGRIDVLINNAALDPKVKNSVHNESLGRLENFDLKQWDLELKVGLTGAFLCTQVFGLEMVKQQQGVIINVSSDLGIIAPDQRLYERPGMSKSNQPVKPVTYSVIKHGLIGLTKYIATYWAMDGIRANTLCPAGIYNNHPTEFVEKISKLIPLQRMANINEYKAAIVFLSSEASSYMNGQTLIIDGGRSIM